ncbi:MAG: acyl-CoA thioesterase [Lachnospiraceae bacterium]|nr:acyl-CoA thioesterase [Lachnospiraceae bacterium]
MQPYHHRVQYYETDMMGVTHHSNYIRWMEEARTDFMDQMGFPYTRMEAEGVRSPVRSLSCEFKRPTTFGDEVEIRVSIESFNGLRMAILYEMRDAEGEIVFAARSEHAFLNREGRIVRMRRAMPAFCEAVEAVMLQGETE